MYKKCTKKKVFSVLYLIMFLPTNIQIDIDFVEGARLCAAGLATIGVAGTGVGIVQFSRGFY